jgi:3-hydroxybutyryl-CoA dehydrogenase
MGSGIAQVAAVAGYDVTLVDVAPAQLDRALQGIEQSLEKLVARERVTADAAESALGRIERAGEPVEADLAIEAATEDVDLKLRIFRELDAAAGDGAVLASNTSSIPITQLAAVTSRPHRVVGMHFMNPVPLMKLVEIVRGLPTSDLTYQTTVELAQRFGKTTIGARDIPGFIVNRMLIPLLNEACYGLYEGLGSAADIDTGVKLGLNHPMGPLELADLIGLDTCLAIAEVLHRELGDDKYRPCPLLRQYVAAGWLGKKVGRGFYSYDKA